MYWSPETMNFCHLFVSSERHRCGYCKQSGSSISDTIYTTELTVECYQKLIDRGWRRSGKTCYKPRMQETCCPQYPIRCDVTNFKLTKSQKKILRKLIRYLSIGESVEKSAELGVSPNDGKVQCPEENKTTKSVKKGTGPDPSKPPCKKAKELRLGRKQEKLQHKNLDGAGVSGHRNRDVSDSKSMQIDDTPNVNNEAKTLADYFSEIESIQTPVHKLRVALIDVNNEEWQHFEAELFFKYQQTIHLDSPESCTKNRFERFLIESPFQIEIRKENCEQQSFKESYELFAKYQSIIHKEPLQNYTMDRYCDFLIESPLKAIDSTDPNVKFGSFHQQYWLDDTLIAVGVIDILPNCLSSVYFFYDPDYNHLSLGTLGALYEIMTVQKWQKSISDLKFYYMGFYIHNCPKMRYKINMNPSYLLCPETYVWIDGGKCKNKFDSQLYSRLQDDSCDRENDKFEYFEENAYIAHNHRLITINRFFEKCPSKKNVVEKFAKLFGQYCANRIIIIGIHGD